MGNKILKSLMRYVTCFSLILLLICNSGVFAIASGITNDYELGKAKSEICEETQSLKNFSITLNENWEAKGPLAFAGADQRLNYTKDHITKIRDSLISKGISAEAIQKRLQSDMEQLSDVYAQLDQDANRIQIHHEILSSNQKPLITFLNFRIYGYNGRVIMIDENSYPLYTAQTVEDSTLSNSATVINTIVSSIGMLIIHEVGENLEWLTRAQELSDKLRSEGHFIAAGVNEAFNALRYHITCHTQAGEPLKGILLLPDRINYYGSLALSGGACTSVSTLLPWLLKKGIETGIAQTIASNVITTLSTASTILLLAYGPAIMLASINADGSFSLSNGWSRITGEKVTVKSWMESVNLTPSQSALEHRQGGVQVNLIPRNSESNVTDDYVINAAALLPEVLEISSPVFAFYGGIGAFIMVTTFPSVFGTAVAYKTDYFTAFQILYCGLEMEMPKGNSNSVYIPPKHR